MSTLETVPELADGGYWYVVEAVPDPIYNTLVPKDGPNVGWVGWEYNGYMLIRTAYPAGIATSADSPTAQAILGGLGGTHKPFGRVRGV